MMLENSNVFTSYSINDRDTALNFYHNTLGLEVKQNSMGLLEIHFSNGATVFLYPKNDHVAATYTVLNFPVDDLEATVDRLAAKGVRFEKYGGDIKTDEKGISRGNGPMIAWFKDPSGNILSVLQNFPEEENQP